MKPLNVRWGFGLSLLLVSPMVLAATQEEALANVTRIMIYASVLFVLAAIAGVYFMQTRDRRLAPVSRVFEKEDAIHAVDPDTPVSECVRQMTAEGIGALVVMDGTRLAGIFTERDALKKVLAGNLDPRTTKVSEVMTRDPCCIAPTSTVGAAMELITQRRFRHLPVVDGGKLIAVLSSGDLTHWLVHEKLEQVQALVGLPSDAGDRVLEDVWRPAQRSAHIQ